MNSVETESKNDHIFSSKTMITPLGTGLNSLSTMSIYPYAGALGFDIGASQLFWGDGLVWNGIEDGDVVGPNGAGNTDVAIYNGTTGKLISDSGRPLATMGNVFGPTSAGPNDIAIYNGGTGKIIMDSGVTIASLTAATEFAEFFALMPGDNAATVAIDAPILFPQNGETSGGGITRISTSVFQMASIGTYQVSWQVSVTEAAQVLLWVNTGAVAGAGAAPAKIPKTVVGRATGTSQLSNTTLIRTTATNTQITVRNGASASALTITPIAGGTDSVSANLVIRRVA